LRAPIFQLDAFTTRRFAGTAAAVVPLARGVPEDPVTGSAHCALAPYWGTRLNKTAFRAFQASARGGEVICRLSHDRVELEGTCVFYLEGQAEI
jgi:predicted PhzF superfamily epimerase YddE/YHI9